MGEVTTQGDPDGISMLVEATGRDGADFMYTLRWADGYTSRYPFVWLKDHCRCKKCFLQSATHKMNQIFDIDPEERPLSEEIANGGHILKVRWENDHTGEYPSPWLRENRFDKGTLYDPLCELKMVPWGRGMGDSLVRFEHANLMESDDALFEFLKTLCISGIALITGAPVEEGVSNAFSKRISFLRDTIYGHEFYIKNSFNPSDVAFTSNDLGLHSDLPYYKNVPGVQLLHCIRQFKGTGGDNQFADGAHAAQILKKRNQDAYKMLTDVPVNFKNSGNSFLKFHMIQKRPTIEEDEDGNFTHIYYNDIMRASYMDIPVEKIQDFYRALKLLHQTLYENIFNFKLKEGDIMAFNNSRVLHGRSGFVLDESSGHEVVRHYEGGFIDWDEITSRMRVLCEERNGELRL